MPRAKLLVVPILALSWVAACSVDWSLDPTSKDFPGKGSGASTTGGGGAGGGGTGGEACDPAACPVPPNECEAPACVNGQCATEAKPDASPCGLDGLLLCEGGACKCMEAAQCTPTECNDVACHGGVCEYTPNTTLACGPDDTGSCGTDGLCGLCDDGVKNGQEADVDCGPASQCGACPGEPCAMPEECAGASCQDGVCCDAPCDGKCMGCDGGLTGLADGVCGPLTLGDDDPDFSDCNSQGGCGIEAGFCLCEDGQQNDDETDVDCGGLCGNSCTTGLKCKDNGDCANGNPCVDGVCCNSDCSGDCGGCNQPGIPGLCSPLLTDTKDDCSDTQECSGESSCKKTNGESCSNSSDCASGLCKASDCVACDNGDNACGSGEVCVAEHCLEADLVNGDTCLDGTQCASTFCVDSVCCESACEGMCMACQGNYTAQNDGLCQPMLSGYDPQSECPGPGAAATCSGAPPDGSGDSSCGTN
jgi:hypothetical protein